MIVPIQQDSELATDFAQADNVTGALHVWWLGHSGFLLKWNGKGILIDPYLSDSLNRRFGHKDPSLQRMTQQLIDPLFVNGIDFVLASHNQMSHLDPETILPLRSSNPLMKMVLPAGIENVVEKELGKAAPGMLTLNEGTYVKHNGIEIHGIKAANPEAEFDENGNSKNLGFLIIAGPFSIYFSGDTVWHDSLVRDIRRWPVNLA
ncbi:MAG: MBL fold metallo-hydrolase, partial [Verrucomicrobiota bacterium]